MARSLEFCWRLCFLQLRSCIIMCLCKGPIHRIRNVYWKYLMQHDSLHMKCLNCYPSSEGKQFWIDFIYLSSLALIISLLFFCFNFWCILVSCCFFFLLVLIYQKVLYHLPNIPISPMKKQIWRFFIELSRDEFLQLLFSIWCFFIGHIGRWMTNYPMQYEYDSMYPIKTIMKSEDLSFFPILRTNLFLNFIEMYLVSLFITTIFHLPFVDFCVLPFIYS